MTRRIVVSILLLLPWICFAQQRMLVTGRIPHPYGDRRYEIQVGAFRVKCNAERTYRRLENACFRPVLERYHDFTRVKITNVTAKEMPHCMERLQKLGFREVVIREERRFAGAGKSPPKNCGF